jgi:hypothetical protein
MNWPISAAWFNESTTKRLATVPTLCGAPWISHDLRADRGREHLLHVFYMC